MKIVRITLISLSLLAFVSCENSSTMKSDAESEMIQSDTSKSNSDYQNQETKRTNSDTINQAGSRPIELDERK